MTHDEQKQFAAEIEAREPLSTEKLIVCPLCQHETAAATDSFSSIRNAASYMLAKAYCDIAFSRGMVGKPIPPQLIAHINGDTNVLPVLQAAHARGRKYAEERIPK